MEQAVSDKPRSPFARCYSVPGGFSIAVDREQAIMDNIETIRNMTMPKTTEKPRTLKDDPIFGENPTHDFVGRPMKPREWFPSLAALNGGGGQLAYETTVHVIEYAAYQALAKRLAESEALCETMREMYEYGYESKTMHSAIVENEKLKAENERLRNNETGCQADYANLERELTREREAAKVMREALNDIVRESSTWDLFAECALKQADEIRGKK